MEPSTVKPTQSRRRRILFAAAAFALGALAAVGTVGVLLRLREGKAPYLGEAERRRWSEGSPAKARRLLVVGDSFLMSWPGTDYLQNYFYQFCKKNEIGLIIAAQGGFGPVEYAQQGVAMLERLHPQLMLLFYHVGNDLTDVLRYQRTARFHDRFPDGNNPGGPLPPGWGEPGSPSPDPAPNPRPESTGLPTRPSGEPPLSSPTETRGTAPLLKQGLGPGGPLACEPPAPSRPAPTLRPWQPPSGSHWERMVKGGLDREIVELGFRSEQDKRPPGHDYVNGFLLLTGLEFPTFHLENILMESPRSQAAWTEAKRHLKTLFAAARRREAQVVVVAIPSMVQVSRAQVPFLRKARYTLREALHTSDRPQQLLGELCREQGVRFLDLLPLLRGHPEAEALYWKNDDHFSDLGHRTAFQIVLERVLDPWLDQALDGQAANAPSRSAP